MYGSGTTCSGCVSELMEGCSFCAVLLCEDADNNAMLDLVVIGAFLILRGRCEREVPG